MAGTPARPRVSVVIPTFDRAEVLGRALRSALAQSFDDVEVIVVDDASGDDTRQRVAELRAPGVRCVVHARRRGGGAARNTGIAEARGALVAFLDSDDEWRPHTLARQVECFERAEADVGVVYTGRTVVGDGTETVWLPRRRGWVLPALLAGNFVGTTSAVMVRRTILQRVGGFDEGLASCQDWDLLIRLARVCRFDGVAEPLVRYHDDPDRGRISRDLAAVVAGRLGLLAKLAAEPGGGRKTRAIHYLQLGHRCCALGAPRQGRAYLLRALAACPLEWRALVCATASVLGPSAYRSLVRARRASSGIIGR
jgi:glycosyltransferase involved in cell wall biosynthesis